MNGHPQLKSFTILWLQRWAECMYCHLFLFLRFLISFPFFLLVSNIQEERAIAFIPYLWTSQRQLSSHCRKQKDARQDGTSSDQADLYRCSENYACQECVYTKITIYFMKCISYFLLGKILFLSSFLKMNLKILISCEIRSKVHAIQHCVSNNCWLDFLIRIWAPASHVLFLPGSGNHNFKCFWTWKFQSLTTWGPCT